MREPKLPRQAIHQGTNHQSLWPWLLGGACLLIILLGVIVPRDGKVAVGSTNAAGAESLTGPGDSAGVRHARLPHHPSGAGLAASADEVVAQKVSLFARGRWAITSAMAKKFNVAIPPEVERFFATAEAGQWDRLKEIFETLRQKRQSTESDKELQTLWGPILETYGVAEIAHLWPAQRLLDYGHAVLDSLRPGVVYVGGTDAGRFIPTLLNDTSEGERHIVLIW